VLIDGASEITAAFSTMAKAGAQAVIVQVLFEPHTKALQELASKHRMAYMSSNRPAVVAGSLVSISANFLLLYEQAAPYVDKIIKGANPAHLPVEQPSKFQVFVNNKTAETLGLSISPSLLAQIDEVIE
jgi:putative tryptophan/tyrosine transport system substrate-binding protein